MQIAIIDDGINEKYFKVGFVEKNIEITPSLEVKERGNFDHSLPSHGTTCAAIISKYSPDAVFISIKILNDVSRRGMCSQLTKAISWCVEKGVRLINLSLGTIDFRDFKYIENTIQYAYEKGVVVIAACNNKNIYTFPASLPQVIGVKCDTTGILKEGEYIFNSNHYDGIDITACGIHKLIKMNRHSKSTSNSNSFAAPYITAMVHRIMLENPEMCIYSVRRQLKKSSSSIGSYNDFLPFTSTQVVEKIDVPVIVVYYYSLKKIIDIIRTLSDLFMEDGYNATSVLDEDGILSYRNPHQIRPSERIIFNRKRINTQDLKTIYSIYNSDILIVGLCLSHHTLKEFEEFEKSIEVDIKIIVEENSYKKNLIIKNAKDSKIIIISVIENTQYQYENAANFTYVNKQDIRKIYEYIMTLYL
jgi:hypothetical protein